MAKLSPMMEQYFEIKKNYEDTLLFFRLGDFYEMFFDDAKVASKELELVLTGRDCGQEERAPMCGVPFHSADSYIAKLVSRGYKVAICEQVEDPATAKGLVKREVVRIVTPGTVVESEMLPANDNNYLASIYCGDGAYGITFADVSTGEIYATCVKEMAQVVKRTATSRAEATLIILFFFIVEKFLSCLAFQPFLLFFPFPGKIVYRAFRMNNPSAENAAAFIYHPRTWLPKEEYT